MNSRRDSPDDTSGLPDLCQHRGALMFTPATQKDIDKIAANVEQMEKCAKEGKFPAELDTEFHCLLAAASGERERE